MKVEPLLPDTGSNPPFDAGPASGTPSQGAQFAQALDAIGAALNAAQTAEDAFAAGTGTLQSAVYDRARADVALSVATATAQRSAQALQAILNMGV